MNRSATCAQRCGMSWPSGSETGLRCASRIEKFCLDTVGVNLSSELPADVFPGDAAAAEDLARLIRHRPTAFLLAADRLAAIIETGRESCWTLIATRATWSRETARRISESTQARQHLQEWTSHLKYQQVQPLAASLLHATVPDWRPEPGCYLQLERAYLDGVQWSGLNLEGTVLRYAELKGADLTAANLANARADRAQFQQANLHGACLTNWRAEAADLSHADLRWTIADHAQFRKANLAGASFIEANLWKADLRDTQIDGADFTGANLEDAHLTGLKLCLARFDKARFGGADLRKCDLEEMHLPDADFHVANLRGAC